VTDRIVDAPLQLGLFAHFAEESSEAESYLEFLRLFEHAEEAGFGYAWVRQFHFRTPGSTRSGGLPSPFVLLAALAERTRRLRLGTAAITLPLEDPVRVAEDAAVLDAISGGRLELGVANGVGAPGTAEALGRSLPEDREERRQRFLDALDLLLGALRGEPLTADGHTLAPVAPALTERIWEATLTAESARAAGERGYGVLVGTTQTVPAETTAAAYLGGLPADAVPRLGLSTLILPGRTREEALRGAEEGIERKWAWGKEFLPPATTLAEKARSLGLHYGTTDDIVDSIATHPAFRYTTHLQVQLELVYRSFAQRHDALDQFTAEIAPALGWSSPAPALAGAGR
jgi:alkanesulfonate monooxygenase SsuD/methylene tetrahydromethanopterin reductase-like flavin-dependent oxidoreductase (luciferase family)